MKYEKLLEKYSKVTIEEVEAREIDKILALNEAIENIKSLSWKVKSSAKDVNKLYSFKNDEFVSECKKVGLKVQYPLDLRPKEIIELQNELDNLGRELYKTAESYSAILIKSL